ncbi:MAG TPA: hypothetical protein PK693_02560 [Halothiobacillus sp.]|nr:hypothetical protein [Halothiobacillus sp.]HQS28625.1 hypothetical protein [Halothiobacillus sp.]
MRFEDAGLSLAAASAACGVSERTFRRWEADNRAPLAVLKLLRLLAGRLDSIDSKFSAFWISQGRIFNDQFPKGILAGDLRAANYIQQERDILRTEVGQLRARLSAMTQPPAQIVSSVWVPVVPIHFPLWWKSAQKTAQNSPQHTKASLSRIYPRWLGFSARAGPKTIATNNSEKRLNSSGIIDTNTGAALCAFDVLQNPDFVTPQYRKIVATNSLLRAGAKGSVSPCTARGRSHSFIDNQQVSSVNVNLNLPDVTSGLERQACRYEHGSTLSATHGCVAPQSMDGRASQYPAPLVPQSAPLALQSGAGSSASRSDSSHSFSANAQNEVQNADDIKPTNYLLCEIGNKATHRQANDIPIIFTESSEASSFAGCKSVTPDFKACDSVYRLRFEDAGLSLAAASAACGVSERTFRRWEADNRAPLAVLKLLRLLAGRLDSIDSKFSAFWISQGRIFNDQFPKGILAGDLRAANYVQQERDILRTEIGQLRAQLECTTGRKTRHD